MGFSKKTVAAIIFALLILLIGGYVYWQETASIREGEQEKLIQETSERVFEISQSGKLSECDKVSSSLGGIDYQRVCKNNVILKSVANSGNIGLCSGISEDLKEECNRLAVDFLVSKADCSGLVGSEKSYCENRILVNEAIKNNNPNVCDSVLDKTAASECKNMTLLNMLSQNSSNVSCSSFSDSYLKSDCEKLKKSISEGNLNFCGSINNQTIKLVCLTNR